MIGKRLVGAGIFLVLLALALFGGSLVMLRVMRAQGMAVGFETALMRSYQMGRPIPDGQYVTPRMRSGQYRIDVTHVQGQGKTVLVKVRVLEHLTGLPLAEATGSADAY